jgi:hypothetical protein
MSDLVVVDEAAIFVGGVTIVEAIGYAAGSDIPVWSKTYSQAATGSFANFQHTPGDAAAVLRYATTARTSKNHPVYLFNYFHGVGSDSTTNADDLNPAQKTAIEEYADDWMAGYSDGVNTYVRAGPNGATATARLVLSSVRHRDFRT